MKEIINLCPFFFFQNNFSDFFRVIRFTFSNFHYFLGLGFSEVGPYLVRQRGWSGLRDQLWSVGSWLSRSFGFHFCWNFQHSKSNCLSEKSNLQKNWEETMKIVRKDLVPDGPGSVKVFYLPLLFPNFLLSKLCVISKFVMFQMVPVDSDDLWYAYNLIAPGDSVMAVTVRYLLFFLLVLPISTFPFQLGRNHMLDYLLLWPD